jgi:hypothetical protein
MGLCLMDSSRDALSCDCFPPNLSSRFDCWTVPRSDPLSQSTIIFGTKPYTGVLSERTLGTFTLQLHCGY